MTQSPKVPKFTDEEAAEVDSWVKKTQERIRRYDPSRLIRHSKAQTKLLDHKMCEGRAGDQGELAFVSDERDERPGGRGAGPYPLEYFLSGFGFCEDVQFGRYAPGLGVRLKSVETDLDGWFDYRGMLLTADVSPQFTGFKVTHRIEAEADEEPVRKLVNTVHKACAVYNTLKKAAEIETTVFLNGKELMRTKEGQNVDNGITVTP